MSKSRAFKYAYRYQNAGKGSIELFGRDTKLSNDELEQMRRDINREHFPAYLRSIWLVNQRTGVKVADSRESRLPAEPLFQVVA
jgi:hypothetical protein